MPIETTCQGCGSKLRVADEFAGRQARCPKCQMVYQIPAASPFSGPAQPTPGGPSVAGGAIPGNWPDAPTWQPERPNPYAADAPAVNPYQPPGSGMTWRGTPHRGVLVLVLGILSFACCVFFGVAAWIMGHADLREMQAGRMDPSGRTLTQVGMILGIIHCCLTAVVMLMYTLIFAMALISDAR